MKKFKYPDSIINKALPDISDEDRTLLETQYLDFLSEEQAEVALHNLGPLMVIAGPGSGKTETMVRRAAILIDFYKVKPENIALTTFTEKASKNLLDRLKNQVKDPTVLELLTIGTIHSFCLKLLEEYGIEHGLFKRTIRVLDDHRQSLFVYTRSKEIGLGSRPDPRSIQRILSYYSSFQEKGADIEKILKSLPNDANEELVTALESFEKYKSLLDENNALDFSTILTKTVELLNHPDARKKIQSQYQYLIVDEYQDTNPIQDLILRTIAEPHNNIAIIGDDDQSIYRFRGATVSNFINFPSIYSNCTRKEIGHNRRSSKEIVEFSNKIVARIPGVARTQKKIFTSNPDFQEISISEYETEEAEIEGISETILELKSKGIINNWRDVAILSYSISSIYQKIQPVFDAKNIPFSTKGDKSYLKEDSVRAIISIIEFITMQSDRITDFSKLKAPIFNCINPKSIEFLESYQGNIDVINLSPDLIGIESIDDKKRLLRTIARRRKFQETKYKEYSDLIDLLFQIFEDLQTFQFLQTSDTREAELILSQIGKFTSLLSDFSNETGSKAFSNFKEFLLKIVGDKIDTPSDPDIEDAVTLQTIHQSKGLEYPIVFMPGLTQRRFPGYKSENVDMPMDLTLYKYWKPNPDVENKDIDFRRLFYVATTRAEKLFYPSYFKKNKNTEKRSMYLDEIIENDGVRVVPNLIKPSTVVPNKKHSKKDKLIISSSHLQYYMYCPTRFKYNLKNSIQAPHRGYFAFGSSVHSMIEEMTNTIKQKNLDVVPESLINEIFESNWSKHGFENLSAERRQKQSAIKYFSDFCNTHVDLMKNIKISEKKFTIEESNFILTGKIDAIIQSANSTTIVDFKSGKKDKFSVEPESIFADNQANIYIEAANRMQLPESSSFYLHFLGESQADEHSYKKNVAVTKESRINVLALLSETADRIQCNDFAPIEEELRLSRCSKCEYRKLCPYQIIEKKAA